MLSFNFCLYSALGFCEFILFADKFSLLSNGSPLHVNLHVANFPGRTHAFARPVMEVSSRVWCAVSPVCVLYKRLCFVYFSI